MGTGKTLLCLTLRRTEIIPGNNCQVAVFKMTTYTSSNRSLKTLLTHLYINVQIWSWSWSSVPLHRIQRHSGFVSWLYNPPMHIPMFNYVSASI